MTKLNSQQDQKMSEREPQCETCNDIGMVVWSRGVAFAPSEGMPPNGVCPHCNAFERAASALDKVATQPKDSTHG